MKLNWRRKREEGEKKEEDDYVCRRVLKRAKKEEDEDGEEIERTRPLVTIVVPIHNAMPWLEETFESILKQTYTNLEVSVWNDASTDTSGDALKRWEIKFKKRNIKFVKSGTEKNALGAGAARNRCVKQSTGTYLCILDADDVCQPKRVELQLKMARKHKDAIVGSGFTRIPENSTTFYTEWCNSLTENQIYLQQYRELTIIQPTWFFHRDVFDRVGGYVEHQSKVSELRPDEKKPEMTPSDLYFFHRHLDFGGKLIRINKPLVIYRHVSGSVCSRIPRRQLLRARLDPFQRRVLCDWKQFTIWGAGRDGKNFYNDLTEESRDKVVAFCDIDEKKIKRGYHDSRRRKIVPVVHFSQAKPPIVICVAMGRSGGALERNIASLGLKEGIDYWHFI